MSNATSNVPAEITSSPRIAISYDSQGDRFSVTFTDTQCGYFVPRGDVVGDYRNAGEVITEILCGANQYLFVILDKAAEAEIDIIWNANIQLF